MEILHLFQLLLIKKNSEQPNIFTPPKYKIIAGWPLIVQCSKPDGVKTVD